MTIGLGVLWLVAGALLALVGVLAGYGKLRPNSWAGIRTKGTQLSVDAWYAAHLAAGPWLAGSGGLVAMTGALLLLGRPDVTTTLAISIVLLIFIVVAVVGAVAVGDRAGKKVASRA